jgi:predicted Zn-ribbon and HTH transcriptional regulator
MESEKRIKIKCKKCGYEWEAKIVFGKKYYQCPICKNFNRADEVLTNGK